MCGRLRVGSGGLGKDFSPQAHKKETCFKMRYPEIDWYLARMKHFKNILGIKCGSSF